MDMTRKAYWIVLYYDNTYHEIYGTREYAVQWAEEHKERRGGSYRLVEWKD